jgi:hypothetical protein
MQNENKHIVNFREFHLKADEQIVAWGGGYIEKKTILSNIHEGVLIVTPERVIFHRKGLLGEILETIPLKKITSIERKSFLAVRTICLHTSHDKLEFKSHLKKDEEKKMIDAIEQGRDNATITPDVKELGQNNPIEALKKLGELKELGVLTEEEFQNKKSELLAKI